MKKSLLFTLLAVCINFAAFAQTFTGTGGAIPDAGITPTCFTTTVSGVPTSSGVVEVVLDITHTFDADLDIYLKGPDGALFELSTDNGAAGANYTGTRFIMNAPSFIYSGAAPFNLATGYRPEGCGGFNLVNSNNADKNGTWSLCIRDDNAGNIGTLNSWSLIFNTVNNNPMPSDSPCDAPLVCSFDSYSGITYPAAPPAGAPTCYLPGPTGLTFCGSDDNSSWLQFIASSSTVVLGVNVGNCTSGIQFAVYSTTNCASGAAFSYATGSSTTSCYNSVNPGSTNLTFTGLTSGTTYYMMIDGFGGDICNYTINPISGVSGTLVTPSVPASQSICAGESVTLTASSTGATAYSWSSIPAGFTATTPTVVVNPSVTTTYFVTASVGSGACVGPQTASTTVSVYVPNVVASGDLLNCDSDEVTLTLTNPPATAGPYTQEVITYSPQTHTGTNVTLGDDNSSAFLPIGFNFTFYGTTYNQFIIASNGYIGFTNTNMGSLAQQTLPNTDTPNNLIALAWCDLNVQSVASRVKYETTGTAPNRVLKVSFEGVPFFSSTYAGQIVSGQILLYETTNYIDVICINIGAAALAKTMGIENATGSAGVGATGKNNVAWSCSNSAVRFKPPVPNITWSTGAIGVTSITTAVGGAFSLTANTCPSNVVNIAVTPSRPILPNLPNINICSPTTVNGRATNPQGSDIYSWTGPGGFTANTASITVSVPGVYTVTISRPSGSPSIPNCVRTKSFTATIPAPPIVTVGTLFNSCDPFTIDADPSNVNSASTVYTWTELISGTVLAATGDVASLTPGIYTVKASNGPLCERTSSRIVVQCPTPTVSAVYDNATSLINVSWSDTSSIELGFELQRTTDLAGGVWTNVNYPFGGTTFPANSLEFIDALLDKGKTYCYRVRYILPTFTGSTNPNYSAYSNVACATVPKAGDTGGSGLPPYEYAFTGAAGNQSVTLTWANPDAAYGFDAFDVYFGIAPQEPNIRISTVSANTFTITGLVNGTTYNFKVRARYRGTANFYSYSDMITLRPSIILGQDELTKPFNFDIAPNPNNGEFELKLSGTPSSKVKMQIFNVAGQVVMTKVVDGFAGSYQETFNLNHISSGLYFLQIDTDNESMQKKISIVR